MSRRTELLCSSRRTTSEVEQAITRWALRAKTVPGGGGGETLLASLLSTRMKSMTAEMLRMRFMDASVKEWSRIRGAEHYGADRLGP